MDNKQNYLVPLSILGAGVIVAASILLLGQKNGLLNLPSKSNNPPPSAGGGAPNPPGFQEITSNIPIDGAPFLGSNQAKVTMIEFSDFQCPFCGSFFTGAFPELKAKYIDTGKVKLVYKQFPLTQIHNNAEVAAEASLCAQEQNKFWPYHDKLFENQSNLDKASLKKYAVDLGLNTSQFNSCLDSGQYRSKVQNDLQDGTKIGIQGTPSFVINGTLIPGAYPASEFEKVIDQKLQ